MAYLFIYLFIFPLQRSCQGFIAKRGYVLKIHFIIIAFFEEGQSLPMSYLCDCFLISLIYKVPLAWMRCVTFCLIGLCIIRIISNNAFWCIRRCTILRIWLLPCLIWLGHCAVTGSSSGFATHEVLVRWIVLLCHWFEQDFG